MASRLLSVADCETDPFKIGRVPQPFVWGFYDGAAYMQFPWHYSRKATPTEDFIAFLREQPIICYAHNGGKFDWHFLLPYLNPYDKIMIINGRISQCFIGLCELRDSYNILPVPLRAYKKDDIDYRIMEQHERYKPQNWNTISKYLKSDCVYLHELISGFVSRFGLRLTQAGAAMAQWKTISDRAVPSTDKDFYDLLSPYYYGGRVECFRSGVIDESFAVYDINSAYPYAMQQKHPYSGSFSQVEAFIPDADFYKVECVSRGAFPFRGMGQPNEFAGLRFPNDGERRIYTVTGWEYQAAKDTGTISDDVVLESIVFDEHIDFSSYIQHFYDMRMKARAEKDAAGDLFAKLLMNSLYGKFASNPEHYRDYMIVPMDVIGGLEAEGWEFAGELGPWGLAERKLDEVKQRYYNVATGASITGYVRAMLWRAIASSKGVLYCDTDSIAVSRKGDAVTLGDKLGQWKHEGDFDRAGIAGKKLYIFRGASGWWTTAEGKTLFADRKPKGATRLYKSASKGAKLTHAQLWQVARGGMVEWFSEAPTFSVNKAPTFTNRRIKYTAKG
jgi:hypothetical protein